MKESIFKKIEIGYDGFSKGQKAISDYIIGHYEKAAYMTAAKLGELANVSESTVVRFACQLGFDGYPDFQKSLRELVRTNLTSFERVEVSDSIIGDKDILTQVLLADAEKLRNTLDTIDRKAFEDAVDKIITAKRIYILGVRSSATLAGFLHYNLRMAFDNLTLVQTTSGSEMLEQLMHISKDDVMIAISFPRYSKRIVNAVEFARDKGADIIALTDSNASPIAQNADQVLAASSDMASFVDSLVAPMSIINAIAVSLAKKKKEELTIRLKTLEKIWDDYDVYDKNYE
ncbi:MAG: MurR/RpiR family transcriptional regulator [Clostridia bacterium]|nr:MurR/RpiR family transcriptional regulator [Clostridia bacterium]